ncbi:MAG TPA: trans-aconitate 2-methyltransferase [Dongiaceae bacterium]|nr:trans-aconitate 2-methyltransferase [Dongiaceae bacterium]
MADWNAELYRQFERERTRPAEDLLARIALADPSHMVDLGCGPGNSTELLVRRFPAATVTGLDTSEDMLASAAARLPSCRFIKADIASWQPGQRPDLLYANASLQWVPDHQALFPKLLAMLAPGGVLAVQMPDNFDEPSHRLMRQVAAEGPWSALIGNAAAQRVKRLPLPEYYDLLAPRAAEIDIWRTIYHHPMPSAEAIVDWVRATGLRPFLDPLPAPQQTAFLAAYLEKIDGAYAPRADGNRLLAFPRMFMVARRKD